MTPIVYKRYKDDINFIVEVESQEGSELTKDEVDRGVISEIKRMADSDPAITCEMDIGSNHQELGGRLPLLDIEVWIGRSNTGADKILHSHYVKEVATRSVMNFTSSHSMTTKVNVMTNEISRILKNCSRYLEWRETAEKVTYFMKRLEYSGYDEVFRLRILQKALSVYDRKVRR